ncbi:MAG: hypothetical protein IPH08_03775 [Rhodocyclaceae bacterium]|nr:hypothetical protein [Rhodocyclaceae bacterium]
MEDEMTVGELSKELAALGEPDSLVAICINECDGAISEMEGFFVAAVDPKTGRVGLRDLSPKEKRMGFTEEDVVPGGVPAVVFMPFLDAPESPEPTDG